MVSILWAGPESRSRPNGQLSPCLAPGQWPGRTGRVTRTARSWPPTRSVSGGLAPLEAGSVPGTELTADMPSKYTRRTGSEAKRRAELGGVERARELLRCRDLDRIGLGRPLELRVEPIEALLGLGELRLRVADALPDHLEVVPEAIEIALELRDVRHHLVRTLLDLHPLEPEHDDLQLGRERRRRHGEDTLVVRVLEQRTGSAADELVVHALRGQVHEREVVRTLVRADVLVRDRVDVVSQVTRERLLVERPLVVALSVGEPLEVVERELGVDRDEPLDLDDRIDALAGVESVLELVGVRREAVAEKVAEEELAEAAASLRRPQGLLELLEVVGARQDLGIGLAQLAELEMDGARRLRRSLEAAVHGRGHRLQPAVDVGIAVGQLASRLGAQVTQLRTKDAQHAHAGHREAGREQDQENSRHGHGPTNGSEGIGRQRGRSHGPSGRSARGGRG